MTGRMRKSHIPRNEAKGAGRAPGLGDCPQAAFLPVERHPPLRSPALPINDALRARGLVLARADGTRPEHALRARGLIDDAGFAALMADELAIPLVDLATDPPTPALLAAADPVACLRRDALPWREEAGQVIWAVADPVDLAERGTLPARLVIAPRDQIRRVIHERHGPALVARAETLCPAEKSCRSWLKPARPATVVLAGLFLILAAALFPEGVALAIVTIAFLTPVANIALRLLGLLTTTRAQGEPAPLPDRGALPSITLMLPLHRENGTLRQLLDALEMLHYPPSKCEFLLITEADDTLTRTSLTRYRLPANARVIVVPEGRVQTKPRALNLALCEARGEIVGVLDAEDRPEPDQLLRTAAAFAVGGARLACVQGTLDYYNARENWIARCFTIEYAIWFRVVLPAFARFALPVPLGGTTMYVRRDVLEKIGGWDAHNVTEDADLGLRLAREGWQTQVLATTTFEEANHRPWRWIRQRSRWLKGYVVTWITHMRHPRTALRAFGWRGLLALNAHFAGTICTFLLAPLYWSLWMEFAGLHHPLLTLAGLPPASGRLLLGFFAGSAIVQYLAGFVALSPPHLRAHRWWLPTLAFYWPMASVALVKALWELPFRPWHWDKTEHGVSRRNAEKAMPSRDAPTAASDRRELRRSSRPASQC